MDVQFKLYSHTKLSVSLTRSWVKSVWALGKGIPSQFTRFVGQMLEEENKNTGICFPSKVLQVVYASLKHKLRNVDLTIYN